MTAINLDADLSEGYNIDEALLALVNSINIVCDWHAGDINTMRQTVGWTLCQSVSIGAHPSFPDRENFGHAEIHLQPGGIYADVLFQIGGLSVIMHAQGGKLVHVKAHGALYNRASRNRPLTMTIAHTIRDFDPSPMMFSPTGDELVKVTRELGLQAKEEVFADRGYNADGSLVKHGTPDALIDSEDAAPNQTLTMVRE